MKTAIAIDPSVANTGYCRGPVDGSGPLVIDSFGIDKAFSGDVGEQLFDFDKKMAPRLTGVDLIFFEKPIRPFGKMANLNILRPLYSISGHIEFMARQRGIKCFEVDNGKHKKLIYGKGGTKPQNTVELAGAWGFECKNADEADACGIWLYSIQKVYEEFFPQYLKTKEASPIVPFIPKPKKKKSK